MQLRCRACGSNDLWQPRRNKSTFDHILARFGYQRLDCRNCKKRSVFRSSGWKRSQKTPTAAYSEPSAPIPVEKSLSQIAGIAAKEHTIIGRSVLIRGDLSSREGIYVYGELEGAVDVDDCGIVIEAGGSVAATVKAGYVVIHGLLRGGMISSSHITVCREGSLIGDARANSLVVEEGAYLQGTLETVV